VWICASSFAEKLMVKFKRVHDEKVPFVNNQAARNIYKLASVNLLVLGSFLNIVAYGSIAPVVVSAIFLGFLMLTLRLPWLGGHEERRTFSIVFSVCWFWAGVAAVYANFFNDPFQNELDAAYFFELVTTGAGSGLGVSDILKAFTENAAAVIVWRQFYDFFSFLGFEKGRYIGIAVNVSLVALTAVIGVRIVKSIFGNDCRRVRRFTLAFALCGVFWLFAAIHIRDAAVLFVMSLLVLFWVRYLAQSNSGNLLQVGVVSGASFFVFGLLRFEFVFVPLAMLVAGSAAAAFTPKTGGSRTKLLLAVIFLAFPIGLILLSQMQSDLVLVFFHGSESYAEMSAEEGGGRSLGYELIVNQPLLLKLLFGSVYLFIFPIPFWSGFQLESVYPLLKSLHVMFMYAIVPLFVLALWRIFELKNLRSPPILFLVFVIAGFTFSIAYTSLETRHYGAFLVPLLVLSMLPNISERRDQLAYRNLLALFLGAMLFVHLAWILLKFL